MKLHKQKIRLRNAFFITILSLLIFQSCEKKTSNSEIKDMIPPPDIEAEDSVFAILSHYYNENPDSALILSQQFEIELKRESNYRGLTRLYSFLSELYQYRINDDVCALNHISKAMDLLAEHPDIYFDNPFLFVNAGNILYNYKMFHEAIYVYKQIEQVVDLNERPEVRTLIDNNIGLSYKEFGMCDSARNYYNKAKQEIVETDARAILMEIQCLNYLSALSIDCGQTDSVPLYYAKAEILFAQIDSLRKASDGESLWNDIHLEFLNYKMRIIANQAIYLNQKGSSELSIATYISAIEEAEKEKQYSWIPIFYAEMAQVYESMDEYEKALQYINQAIEVHGNQISDSEIYLQYLNHKADILLSMDQNRAAEKIRNKSKLIRDSILESQQSNEVINQKIELAVKPIQFSMKKIEIQKDKMLETMQMQLQIADQNKTISMYRWLIITGIMFLSILALIFLIYRNKSRKQLAELSLENAEKEKKFMTSELQNFSMHLVYRNDFLRELQTKLKRLIPNASDKNKKEIKELNIQISQNLQSSHDAKMIDEKLHEINSGFLFNLSEKYPKLTENDKNLCALVRMNLSSKEIASIKNISERSVITARYRLRQKLDLTTDQNLSDFLKSI